MQARSPHLTKESELHSKLENHRVDIAQSRLQAVAAESGTNFISIKGPELLNKYVGESERALRRLFARARAARPACSSSTSSTRWRPSAAARPARARSGAFLIFDLVLRSSCLCALRAAACSCSPCLLCGSRAVACCSRKRVVARNMATPGRTVQLRWHVQTSVHSRLTRPGQSALIPAAWRRQCTLCRVVNQLLTEMDGTSSRAGVYVVAATNRPDIIDPALLRPGRLDKALFVPLPDAAGRAGILRAAARRAPLAADVRLDAIAAAQSCEGCSGADMASLLREAAVASLKVRVLDLHTNSSSTCCDRLPITQRSGHIAEAAGHASSWCSRKVEFMLHQARNVNVEAPGMRIAICRRQCGRRRPAHLSPRPVYTNATSTPRSRQSGPACLRATQRCTRACATGCARRAALRQPRRETHRKVARRRGAAERTQRHSSHSMRSWVRSVCRTSFVHS